MSTHAFSALAVAAYCPRKCYYTLREDDLEGPPEEVRSIRELAFRYGELADADDATLAEEPLAVSPLQFRRNLGCVRARLDRFEELTTPPARDVLLEGRDCRGIAHKVLEDPPEPSLVSAGTPPEQGVWEPQTVRAVAAAKALAYEREQPVERAYYEYPAHGIIRTVPLTTRRKATYRRTVRTLEAIDGPPPRLDDDAKCDPCEYREECGVRTRSLRSLLGL